jgi:hypothetical protein
VRAAVAAGVDGGGEAGGGAEQRGGLFGTGVGTQEYNYKFMAYPILNSLTQETANKI